MDFEHNQDKDIDTLFFQNMHIYWSEFMQQTFVSYDLNYTFKIYIIISV